jgi:hypothetical protein
MSLSGGIPDGSLNGVKRPNKQIIFIIASYKH